MENLCIKLENVEKSFLDRVVLNIPQLSVYQFDRIGIVGKNGAGKSTLLKMMAGRLEPDKGTIQRFIPFAYFDQISEPQALDIDYRLIGKLEIPETDIQHFSGGELTKLKLGHLLSDYYEGMLIDEPTTHLDGEGIKFFIEEMTYYYGALILVSHDRYVLDQLVTKIWEVDEGQVTEYAGNYSDYVAQKELQKRQQQEQHEKYLKEKSRLLQAAEEKKKKAQKMMQRSGGIPMTNRMFMTKAKDTSQKGIQRAAKALVQRVEQLEEIEAPKEERFIRFPQSPALQLHNKFPVMGNQVTLKAGDQLLLKEASFQFPLGQTIAITGKNGSGKTTLLRHIVQGGEGITVSPKVEFGVYEQMAYQFKQDETVLAYMKARSDYDERKIRSVLHAMNFIGNDINKNVRQLSGGESIRLVLCQLFLGRYNVLVLDEPTNFLDVFCVEALEQFIKGYEGTVLLVSHDQKFVQHVADRVCKIENQKLIEERA